MNYFIPKNHFHDGKNYLSDKLETKQWRNIRAIHEKDVIHYKEDENTMYQCSGCGEFHKTFDLHDNWTFTSNSRVLSGFSNLCFKCHALEHLEKLYFTDGKLKAGSYRGVENTDLVVMLKHHYEKVTKNSYDLNLLECLSEAQKRIDSKVVFVNDYSLIDAFNSFYFKKNPIVYAK